MAEASVNQYGATSGCHGIQVAMTFPQLTLTGTYTVQINIIGLFCIPAGSLGGGGWGFELKSPRSKKIFPISCAL